MSEIYFAPIALWEKHLALLVEIVWKNKSDGTQQTILHCDGSLPTCPANPTHAKKLCRDCIFQTKKAIKLFPAKTKHIWIGDIKPASIAKPHELEINISNIQSLREFTYDDVQFGKSIINTIASNSKDITLNSELIEHSNFLIEESIPLYNHLKIFLQNGFLNAYVWGGRRISEQIFVSAAIKSGLKINYFEIGGTDKKIRISRNNFFEYVNIINEYNQNLVDFDEMQLSDLYKFGKLTLENLRMGISNLPEFKNFNDFEDTKELEIIQNKILQNGKKKVVFCTSSLWEFFEYDDSFNLTKDFKNQYDLINRLLQDKFINDKFQLIIRYHPNVVNAGPGELQLIEELLSIETEAIQIPPHAKINTYNLIEHSSYVITSGSTIGLEAAANGKQVILTGRSIYERLKSFHKPKDYSQLLDILIKELENKIYFEEIYYLFGWINSVGDNLKHVSLSNKKYFFGKRRIRRRPIKTRIVEILNAIVYLLKSIV